MSGKIGSPLKLDFDLNLSPPRDGDLRFESLTQLTMVSPTSPPEPCVSIELKQDDNNKKHHLEATSMMVVGCPNCLMYVMIYKGGLKCPICKNNGLVYFLSDNIPTTRK